MIIAHIHGATRVIGKSQGYLGLPLRDEVRNDKITGPNTPCMITAWEPTPDELVRLAKGARVYLCVIGTQHPPVMIDVGFMPCACGDSDYDHLIDEAHGVSGTYMSGSERFVCKECGRTVTAQSPNAAEFPFRYERRKP